MMLDSLDLAGFSTRIDVRRLYPRNNRQSGVGTLAVVPHKPSRSHVLKNKQGKCSMKFTGTKDYVATDDLKIAVNASIVLERPLLIKGEPGTGKTVLAEEVAKAIGAPLLTWHIKSTTKAQQGLYEYDAVSRLRDSQLGDARVSDISSWLSRNRSEEHTSELQSPDHIVCRLLLANKN